MTKKEQLERLNKLLKKYDASLARAFQAGVTRLSSDVNLAQIERLLQQGRIPDVVNILAALSAVEVAFSPFLGELQAAYISGGGLGEDIARASRIDFSFDVTQPGPAQFYREYKARKVQQISQELRSTITQVIQRELPSGTPPAKVARQIRGNLGLTARQEKAVTNYRKYLDTLDSQALDRKLRDKRFDSTVARAMREGKPLTEAQKDKMANAYRRKYIKRRSETIARTESIRMLNGGREQYFRDAVRNGKLTPQQVRRKWIATSDGRLRDAHAAIPRMNRDGVGLNEPFQSPLGRIMYPGDPSASAANVINCRCTTFVRVDS